MIYLEQPGLITKTASQLSVLTTAMEGTIEERDPRACSVSACTFAYTPRSVWCQLYVL